MSMKKASNQTAIGGSRLYYFESLNGGKAENSCIILAHGSVSKSKKTFPVPAGKTINFYTEDGESYRPNKFGNRGIKGAIQQPHDSATIHRNEIDIKYTEGQACKNYSLSKILGRHEFYHKKLTKDADTTYEEVNDFMRVAAHVIKTNGAVKMWSPHVVTVAHKFYSKQVSLKWTVDTVIRHNPNINTIYIAACRVNFIGSSRVQHDSDI
jgi:hypothetical protein